VEPMTAPQHAAVHAPVHARAGIALKRSPGFGPGGRFRPRDRRMGKEHASAHADAVRALGNVKMTFRLCRGHAGRAPPFKCLTNWLAGASAMLSRAR
jgi:hypothetical protein